MKTLFTIFALFGLWFSASAQESMEKIMEKRAREMHRLICLTNKDEWTAFVKENFTQAFIDKPLRAETNSTDDKSSSSSSTTIDKLDAKVSMMSQHLNKDFGKSKIVSLNPNGATLEMVLKNEGGMRGTFVLIFEAKQPYLIDGVTIEVNGED